MKPNMAANGGPNLRRLSLPTRSFMFTCIVKIAPPCPPYLASLFARSVTGRSHSIYIYMELTEGHTQMASNPRQITSADLFFFFMHQKSFNKPFLNFYCIKQQLRHSTSSRVVLFCSLHAVTSSVIYYSTHTWKM